MWNDLQTSPYPESLITDTVKGFNLVAMNKNLSGCVKTYINTGGILDHHQWQSFNQHTDNLQQVIPQLNGNEQVYYAKLYRLCDVIRESLDGKL